MKARVTFTKKDVVVVLCCAVFLLGTLGAVGSGGRKRNCRPAGALVVQITFAQTTFAQMVAHRVGADQQRFSLLDRAL